ncbi:MAG: cytochrome d ubiquinol oxidase subunit II [Deltaproteobacteria bacterium]|jgi:cytochrome d ubiquinol oxidase subunit II
MEVYALLKLTWWVLLGVLLSGLAIMMGMDMGVGIILRYVARTDDERRIVLNVIGPHWDGNQVWFILGGGAIFAAWPLIYATAFSGLYVVMLILLWSMIVRPLGFEYRSRLPSAKWRNTWDWCLFISGFIPMLVYGAAMGNMLRGVPFHFDWNMQSHYTGSFLSLFNPFAILTGLLSVFMAIYQGGTMIMNRTKGSIHERARRASITFGLLALVLFTLIGIWASRLNGYVITGGAHPNGAANPLHKTVEIVSGAWLNNFQAHPVLWILPLLTYVGIVIGVFMLRQDRSHTAWWLGAVSWIGIIGTVFGAMFPFLMPSITHPSQSLTVWDASSSPTTLAWMLGVAILLVPVVIAYTGWAFWVMRGKITEVDPDHSY